MSRKPCGEFKQYSVEEDLKIKYGSIVETIFDDDQRIFYKNEDENNENPRKRWFIERQRTRQSKQAYEMNELNIIKGKIKDKKGKQSGVYFFEIIKKKYSKIYKQTVKKPDKTTIGIPKMSWDTMNDFQKTEYKTLLKHKGITELLLLSPYEFAATNPSQRIQKRNKAKKEAADAKHLLETSELSNLVQLKNAFPDIPENEILRVLDLFNNQIKMAATFLERNK